MSTCTFQDKGFIKELSRELVNEFAPEEIDMFDELTQEYYRNPTPSDKRKQTDDPLGFGLDISFSALTPVALSMATAVLNFVMTSAVEAIKKESAERIQEKVKKLFKVIGSENKSESESIFQIKPEDFDEIRRLAIQEAQKCGYTEKAEQMADELIRPLRKNLSPSY